MELKLNNDTFKLPAGWDQLTKEQFCRLASLSTLKLSENEFKLYLLLAILDLKVEQNKPFRIHGEYCYKLTGNKKIYLISVTDLAIVVINSLAWIFKEVGPAGKKRLEIDCKLAKILIDSVQVGKETWYGPAAAMNNSIYEEYMRCLVVSSEFSGGDTSAIDKLIAALYRPGKPENLSSGDIREPYNDYEVDARAKKLKNHPEFLKLAVLLQFNGHMWSISQTFPETFTSGSAKKSSKNVFMQQLDLIDNLAQHRIPDKEAIRKTPLYDVLHTLNNLIINAPKKS